MFCFVSDRPQEIGQENFSCRVYDWDANLTCKWDYGVEYFANQVSEITTVDSDITIHVSLHTRE